jgi:hypothetical protein
MGSKLTLFLCLLLTLTACGGKKNSKTGIEGSTSLSTVFVKGDPKQLIEGSTLNKTSFITESNIAEFSDYSLSNIWQFTENDVIVEEEDTGSPETGNEATEEDQTTSPKAYYSFSKTVDGYVYSNPKMKLDLVFSINNGKLELKNLETNYGIYDLKILHYSQKKTKDSFSIMAELQDSDNGRVLLSFVFVKKIEQKQITRVDDHYKYIMGPGVVLPWSQQEVLQIDICGNQYKSTEYAFNSALSQWKKALKNRMTIKTNFLTNYPPFSDLNSHCIYTVNDYITEPRPEYINSASTTTNFDTFKGEIIDADIFVWVKEIEKDGDINNQASYLAGVTGHELGHFFGLDHQFDKDYESIMSYDQTYYITEYDNEAINNLYPILR